MKKIITFIKYQFLHKHYVIYIILPILIATLIVLRGGTIKIISEQAINTTIAIIGITGGLLLNFLVIILTSNSLLITKYKDTYIKGHLYGQVNKGTRNYPEICKVNLYDFIYYKIFFLIGMSLLFIVIYIIYFLDFQSLLFKADNVLIFFKINIPVFVNLSKIAYIYLVLLYFISFGHLIYKLYYLFHKDNTIPEELPIIPLKNV